MTQEFEAGVAQPPMEAHDIVFGHVKPTPAAAQGEAGAFDFNLRSRAAIH